LYNLVVQEFINDRTVNFTDFNNVPQSFFVDTGAPISDPGRLLNFRFAARKGSVSFSNPLGCTLTIVTEPFTPNFRNYNINFGPPITSNRYIGFQSVSGDVEQYNNFNKPSSACMVSGSFTNTSANWSITDTGDCTPPPPTTTQSPSTYRAVGCCDGLNYLVGWTNTLAPALNATIYNTTVEQCMTIVENVASQSVNFTITNANASTLVYGYPPDDQCNRCITLRPAPCPTTTTTTTSLTSFGGCGRGNTAGDACSDASANNRTFWSNCDGGTFGVGCFVYVNSSGTPLIGFSNVFMNLSNWDVNPSTGVITGPSSVQC
jgi:hypothetical protein